MKVKDILRKNIFWLIAGSLCSVIISCSVVLGTGVVAEQIDMLTTASATNIYKTIYIVVPAIFIATSIILLLGKMVLDYPEERNNEYVLPELWYPVQKYCYLMNRPHL
ncbi:MAG: hypothetical protein ACI4E1_00205 [Lachnospira sp.]